MRYWIYLNGEVPGSYAAHELGAVPGFTQTTLVCPAEGEIQEKNWRRASEFPELIAALQKREAAVAPPAPLAQPAASDISALLDTTGARLIGHVSVLMKQLEESREHKELISALQRQVAALSMDLKLAREKAAALEDKANRYEQLQARGLKDAERIAELEAAEQRYRGELVELREEAERAKATSEASRRELQRAEEERSAEKRLAQKLERELAAKDASLARAVTVVRRLEETLLPSEPSALVAAPAPAPAETPVPLSDEPPAPPAFEVPSLPALEPTLSAPPAPVAEEPIAPLSVEPPVPAAEAPAAEAPAAQHALIQAFKRLFAKDLHS